MPPKKKAKVSQRGVSTPAADEDSMEVDAPTPDIEEPDEPAYEILKDPWTDEQETSLFKGIMRWKPNGVHKHFRMIALSEYLRNHGYDPRIDKHTRIPGIWQKLGTWYNMEIIDARENSFDDEEGETHFLDFELPEEDYGLETFMRGKRSSSETPSSPPRLSRSPSPPATRKRRRGEALATSKTRASTVDTDEARTSPARSPPAMATRSGRSTNRSSGRGKAEANSRPASKDTMDEDEGADETEETAEDDEQEAEEEEPSDSPKTGKGSARAKVDAAAKTANPSRKSKRKR